MKRGTPTHPKTLLLAHTLGIPVYSAVGLLESLFHFVARYARNGDVGRWPDSAIAEALGWDGDATQLVEALAGVGWLDASAEHRYVLHDWHEHADDSTKKLLKKRGEVFASSPGPEKSGKVRKSPEKDRQPEPKPEPKPEPFGTANALPCPSPSGDLPSGSKLSSVSSQENRRAASTANAESINTVLQDRFQRFWDVWPKKVKMAETKQIWMKIRPSEELTEKIIAAVQRAKSSKQWRKDNGQFIPHPTRYLEGKRWEDAERKSDSDRSIAPRDEVSDTGPFAIRR